MAQYDRAVAEFDRAIRIDPDYAAAFNNRCWARALLGALTEALADCDTSLRLRPESAAALDSRGFVHLRLNQPERAIADYDAALKMRPKSASSLYGRGGCRPFDAGEPRRWRAGYRGGDAD